MQRVPLDDQSYPMGMASKTTIDEAKRLAVRAIANWRDAMKRAHFSSFKAWADKAGMSGSTLTRNMQPDSPFTAKIENLHLLARAANVPSILDFLNSQAEQAESVSLVPSEDELASMIESAMAEMEVGVSYADYPRAVSSALRERLEQFVRAGGSASKLDEESARDKVVQPLPPTKPVAVG